MLIKHMFKHWSWRKTWRHPPPQAHLAYNDKGDNFDVKIQQEMKHSRLNVSYYYQNVSTFDEI